LSHGIKRSIESNPIYDTFGAGPLHIFPTQIFWGNMVSPRGGTEPNYARFWEDRTVRTSKTKISKNFALLTSVKIGKGGR